MASLRPHRCSRGALLQQYRQECWRASAQIGTRGMSGAGRRQLEEARGRLVRALLQRWPAPRVLAHMKLIMKVCATVETQSIQR